MMSCQNSVLIYPVSKEINSKCVRFPLCALWVYILYRMGDRMHCKEGKMLEVNDFNGYGYRLASPEQICGWSYGEVTKPETREG